MKKLIPFLALLVGTIGAYAQGTPDGKIDFANQRTYATTADRLVRNTDGTPLTGTNYIAQLLYGADASSLQPHTGTATFRAGTPTQPGTWIGATRTLNGFSYSTATTPSFVQVAVRVWDIRDGLTFEQAVANGGEWGISDSYRWQIPTSTAVTSAFYMEDLRGFTLVPEPSVIGLGLIGIGALVMLRRRKA